MSDQLLHRTIERVQDSMDEILANFKPGAKITVLVRAPNKPTGDFCLTDDDLSKVIAMVHRRKGDAAPVTPPPVEHVRVDVDRLARSIVTAACELDGPADLDGVDTISITMKDLEAVVHRHVKAALEASE